KENGAEVWRIEAADEGPMRLSIGGPKVLLDPVRSPSLRELFHVQGDLKNVKETTEDRTVSRRTFACKVVSFDFKKGHMTIWMCPDVKASGVVAVKLEMPQGTLELEVAGFGTKSSTDWGQSES